MVAAAPHARERLRFSYLTNEGVSSQRHAEPVHLVALGRRWYLLAHDLDRDDWRVFRMDRITRALATGARFTPRTPPGGDATEYVTRKMYDSAPTYRASVTVQLPVEVARARLGDSAGELRPAGTSSCHWVSGEDTIEYLAFRLTLLACDFTVHGPPPLVDHLRVVAARITRSIGAGSWTET